MHNSKLASSAKSDAIDWRSHFEAYKSQNISRKEYCLQNRLAYSAFGYWCRKLESETDREADDAAGEQKGIEFLEIPANIFSSDQPALELDLENIRIRIYNGAGPELVNSVIGRFMNEQSYPNA